MILPPEGLQNVSGRQRNPTDMVPEDRSKEKAKPKKKELKTGAMQSLERLGVDTDSRY